MKWYKYDIKNFTDDEYCKWYSLMSEDKQHHVDRFRFLDDKKCTVAGEMLARQAIDEWCAIQQNSIEFAVGEQGKPYALGLDVEFNISHSGDMVVCAVDNHPVGIDIEKIRPIDLSITKHNCTDEQLLYLFEHPPTDADFTYTEDADILTRFLSFGLQKKHVENVLEQELWEKIIILPQIVYCEFLMINTQLQYAIISKYIIFNYLCKELLSISRLIEVLYFGDHNLFL